MIRSNPAFRLYLLATFTFAFILPFSQTSAETSVSGVFGSGMVLQRDQPIVVWGRDDPQTSVTVRVAGRKAGATTGTDGRWKVNLAELRAGGPHVMVVEGSSTIRFDDVLVGEVWLCTGQSNMDWPVRVFANAAMEIAAGDHPRIRHFKIKNRPAAKGLAAVETLNAWEVCSPATVGDFTAVGYYFGRYLEKQLDVPIGLIGSTWGGTRIEPWISPEGYHSVSALAEIAQNLDQFPKKDDKGNISHQSALALYNGMIHPLVPYSIRGVLWYQGESNLTDGMIYREKMKALIQGWRKVWNREDLPFYYVQLAPFRYKNGFLPAIWEAQLATLAVPHTGMAVTVDIGNLNDIHPANKQDVGKRLALWALARTYGHSGVVYSGPLYHSMRIEDGRVRLFFDFLGGGLVSRDQKALVGFTIAGADQKFVKAAAVLEGDSVVVSSPDVVQPVAVRFGWQVEVELNLSNAAGLPASPFRTDNW